MCRRARATEDRTLIADLVGPKNAYEAALEDFDQAAEALGLSDGVQTMLRSPESAVYSQVSFAMPDGSIERADAWSVRHNSSRGPAMGGIRYSPAISLDEVTAKAMFMSWKWAVLDIPLGGGKAGVAVDLNKLPQVEEERLTRGELGIVPPGTAGDEGTDAAGPKPREDAAARGVTYAVLAMCERLKIRSGKARVAVHGFGKTGSGAARLLAQSGASVVGVSDTRGAIFRKSGLDVLELIQHKSRSGSVVGFNHAEPITDYELLALDCEVLIVSALEDSIRNRNAPRIQARILVEATDGSITAKADSILQEKGVCVIPDILANAGRATAAYYDSIGSQNPYGKVQLGVRRALDASLAISEKRKVNLRRAAYIIAVSRVAEALQARGTD